MWLFKWFKGQNPWQKSISDYWILITYWKNSGYLGHIDRQYRLQVKSWTGHVLDAQRSIGLLSDGREQKCAFLPAPSTPAPISKASTHLACPPALLQPGWAGLTHRSARKILLYLEGTCDLRAPTRWARHWNVSPLCGSLSQVCAADLWTDVFCCAKHALFCS